MKKRTIVVYVMTIISLLLASCATQQLPPQPPPTPIYTGPRQPVETVSGMLTLHPDSICYKGKDDRTYWLFSDPTNSCLFITENNSLYPIFAAHLPVAIQATAPAVILQGVTIDPVTIFRPEQLQQIANSQNMTLVELNHFKIAKIFGYGTVKNLPAAIATLTAQLKGSGPAKSLSSTSQQETAPTPRHPDPAPASNSDYDPNKDL